MDFGITLKRCEKDVVIYEELIEIERYKLFPGLI